MRSEDAMQQTVLRTMRMPSARDRLRSSLAVRWPHAYRALLCAAALLGVAAPLAFPLVAVLMVPPLIEQLGRIGSGFSVQVFLAALATLVLAGAMTWYLWRERIALPAGRRIDAKDAPLLFPLLKDLQQHFGEVGIDQVLLSPDYELKVERTPRNGFPLHLHTTLTIGLPVLESLSTVHVQVLLAREIGYLARAPRRPGAWLSAMDDVAQAYRRHFRSGWGPQQLVLRVFYRFFAPAYHWLSQEHARGEQRVRDQFPMELINDEVVAQALVSNHFAQYVMHHQFWPAIYRNARRHPTPKHPPYSSLESFMRRVHQKGVTDYWLNHVLADYQTTARSPSLAEHLAEIGHHRITPPRGFEQPASRQLLPARLDAIRVQMDRQWLDENLADWKREYSASKGQWERMKRLIAKAQNSSISADEAWECAQLIQKNLNDQAQVSRFYKQLLTACQGCAKLHYFIGRHLLSGNDRDGILAIESAMQTDHGYVQEGCQLITRYLMRTGRRKEAQEYRRKALAHDMEDAA